MDRASPRGRSRSPPAKPELSASSARGPDGRPVCKDFLRNVCNRGRRCKFYHAEDESASARDPRRAELQFCHDYQNRGCFRENCRYVHCSREIEDGYEASGRVSEELALAVLKAGQGNYDDLCGIPVCKDFLGGRCDRGSRCKYWHLTTDTQPKPRERPAQPGFGEEAMTRNGGPVGPGGVAPWMSQNEFMGSGGNGGPPSAYMHLSGVGGGLKGDYGVPSVRQREELIPQFPMESGGVGGGGGLAGDAATIAAYRSIHEDNLVLRQKLEMLKKQVSDLTAANEVLLEQNARLRAKLQVNSAAAIMTGQPGQGVSSHLTGAAVLAAADARMAASVAAAAASISHLKTTCSTALGGPDGQCSMAMSSGHLAPSLMMGGDGSHSGSQVAHTVAAAGLAPGHSQLVTSYPSFAAGL